jgi:hypothetical protein
MGITGSLDTLSRGQPINPALDGVLALTASSGGLIEQEADVMLQGMFLATSLLSLGGLGSFEV